MSDKTKKTAADAAAADRIRALDTKPGAAIDVADDEKVDREAVKDYTRELNNNPRNTDDIDD